MKGYRNENISVTRVHLEASCTTWFCWLPKLLSFFFSSRLSSCLFLGHSWTPSFLDSVSVPLVVPAVLGPVRYNRTLYCTSVMGYILQMTNSSEDFSCCDL